MFPFVFPLVFGEGPIESISEDTIVVNQSRDAAAKRLLNVAGTPALRNVQTNLFSDLLIHHLGSGLADGVLQGGAGPVQFRTAPLWGLGQRLFFLHDGRTSDLLQAIEAHASPGSEANSVIRTFNGLTESQKQDLLNFLCSL